MINLNDIKDRKLITKERVLRHINDVDVYIRYCPGLYFELNKPMLSPLKKDNIPSFGFFEKRSEILFNDFRIGGGDFVRFVQLKFGYKSRFEALSRIGKDFKLDQFYNCSNAIKSSKIFNENKSKINRDLLLKTAKDPVELNVKSRKWKSHDIAYWLQFGIDKSILDYYNVKPVEYIFLNDNIIKAHKYSYSFMELKDGIKTYKVYQPYYSKLKWITNNNHSVWLGWTQLPKESEQLIITKSLKDVMSLVNVGGIPAVSLQAESVLPKESVVNELKDRFETIYILYDNDFRNPTKNWGREWGNKLAKSINCIQIELPDVHQSKDFSELVMNKGAVRAKRIIDKIIKYSKPPF